MSMTLPLCIDDRDREITCYVSILLSCIKVMPTSNMGESPGLGLGVLLNDAVDNLRSIFYIVCYWIRNTQG